MRSHGLLVAAFLVLSLVVCGLSAEAEELTNDSGKTAVAVRITFASRVMIRGHGREFPTQDPATGRSDVFVFSGGEVRRNRSFEVEWSPDYRRIKSIEWLEVYGAEEQEAMQEIADCSCVLSPSDSLEKRLSNAYDGIVICLEPGIYTFGTAGNQILMQDDITIRGVYQELGEAQIILPEYQGRVLAVGQDSRLTVKNISFGEGFMLIGKGNGAIIIETCDLQYLILEGTASASVENSSLGSVIASDGARVTLTNCAIEIDAHVYGIAAHSDSRVTVVDSVIKNKSLGVFANDDSIVRLIRCEFVDCGTNFSEAVSGKVEIEG